jgi:hypothetical protein
MEYWVSSPVRQQSLTNAYSSKIVDALVGFINSPLQRKIMIFHSTG